MDVFGLTWDDVKDVHGTFDLGYNATGVIKSRIHFTGDEIITEDVMSGEAVDLVIGHVEHMRNRQKAKRPGGDYVGSIPYPLWAAWRKEWQAGPRQHGVKWRKFFTMKFMDRDHEKFRAGNL